MESSPVKIISGAATGAAHKLAPAGTGTGAAAGTSGGKTAAPPSCGHPAKHMDACIEACRNCERVCLDTIPHCLGKGRWRNRRSEPVGTVVLRRAGARHERRGYGSDQQGGVLDRLAAAQTRRRGPWVTALSLCRPCATCQL